MMPKKYRCATPNNGPIFGQPNQANHHNGPYYQAHAQYMSPDRQPTRLYVGYKNHHTTYIYLDPFQPEKILKEKIASFLWRNFNVQAHGMQYHFYFVDQNWTYVEVPSNTIREAFERAKEDFVGSNKVYLYVWLSRDNENSSSSSGGGSNSSSSNNSCSSSNRVNSQENRMDSSTTSSESSTSSSSKSSSPYLVPKVEPE